MDIERIIDDIEQLQEMFDAPDIRPLSASDISAANRRHDENLAQSPWFRLWQRYGVCCRSEAWSCLYVQNGYEASLGSYDVDEVTHTLTHHVEGSNTRDLLVGRDLPRVYQFSADEKLIIRSARPDEHWW